MSRTSGPTGEGQHSATGSQESKGHRRHHSSGVSHIQSDRNDTPRMSEFSSDGCLDSMPRADDKCVLTSAGDVKVQFSSSVKSLSSKRPAALNLEPLATNLVPRVEFNSTIKTMDIAFSDVSYTVNTGIFKRRKFKILQGVSGQFNAGELTAIMGPSGAGKSTLMDILAGYITSWTGSIMVNNEERDLRRFRRKACYIMQDDHLQPHLTVQEAMHIAANLKLSSTVTKENKQKCIKQILDAMGLYESRKKRTGVLSGGQRKRLAISLELVSNPPVMFFDEPTSGLDSSKTKQCIALLRQLAQEGRTVVCTIHQPSALILEMFDHLYAVADGQCIYQGSIKSLIPYLEELEFYCPPYHNPADFFLEIATGEFGLHNNKLIEKCKNGKSDKWRRRKIDSTQINSILHINKMMASGILTPVQAPKLQMFPLSPAPVYNPKKIFKNPLKTTLSISPGTYCKDEQRYPTSFLTQLSVLIVRNMKINIRDRVLSYMRFFIHMSIAVVMGILYFQIGQDAKYTMDNFNFIFFTIMFLMFTSFNSMMLTFPLELPIITREHFNRWYSLKAYYVAMTVSDAPIQFTCTFIYAIITYLMTGQPMEIFRIWYFSIICVLVSFVAQGIGLLNGAIFNLQNGVIFGPLFMLPFTMFSGFFVRLNDAPYFLQWLFHISYIKHGLEGAMLSIFGYSREKVSCSEIYCHYKFPSKFLKEVDMDNAIYSYSVMALCAMCVFVRTLTYFTLNYRLKHRRR